ncbi:600_t:CDS:1, partial [Racocetra persica]
MESKSSLLGIFLIACSEILTYSMALASPLVKRASLCNAICVGHCDTCAFVSSNCTD